MTYNSKRGIFLSVLLLSMCVMFACQKYKLSAKIIGLVAVRNEEIFIKQCLQGLACYTDEIIVLDDASEDSTVAIIKHIAQECRVSDIITKESWYRDEGADRNCLLSAGREHGGTHFIMLDADELFTANCRDADVLKDTIYSLQPGDILFMHWIQLRNSMRFFRCENAELKAFAFCDDRLSRYANHYLHVKRVPDDMKGKRVDFGRHATHGVLHFKEAHIPNLRIRQAWYQCLERIRCPHASPVSIAHYYTRLLDASDVALAHSPSYWFAYDFFDEQAHQQPDRWRKNQISRWLDAYGPDYFRDLAILDLD